MYLWQVVTFTRCEHLHDHRSPRRLNLVVNRDVAFTSYHALGHNDVSTSVGRGYPIKGNSRYGGSEAKLPTDADTRT